MKTRLFLSGPIGCGKSTLLKNTLGRSAKAAGGFVTERALGENGKLVGFDLLPACSLACPERACGAFRFLSFSDSGAARNDGVFRTEAVRLLGEAAGKPFAVLDEFGGYELLVPEFSKALGVFLTSGVPCVGVLKAPAAALELNARAGLPTAYLSAVQTLRAALETDTDTEILETFGRYDTHAEAALRAWTEEYANAG